MWELKTELDGTVLHTGTFEECEMILAAMVLYGIRKDKFDIVPKLKRTVRVR